MRTTITALVIVSIGLLGGCGLTLPAPPTPTTQSTSTTPPIPSFGGRFAWPSGLEITLGAATPHTLSEQARGLYPNIGRVMAFAVTLVNRTDRPVKPAIMVFSARRTGVPDPEAAKAPSIRDQAANIGIGLDTPDLAPGQTFQGTVAFGLPEQPGPLRVEVSPDLVGAQPRAVFEGTA
ncbi:MULTISPECIES: hypothetical protein [unclassified Crossiella]|uniref:hypothetical protein n=1 Tax=unclassified Crossiella TaxID=2620835 RepID=UPI001FFF326B|nr:MULTISPECIES: hypothetical protein [unclassified Crossiella]MCK2236469.1 hypothetical protein [Crossiella sp. S99.2]MCK2250136.1 hypothetical protein [Crossiella sp. S99.1]